MPSIYKGAVGSVAPCVLPAIWYRVVFLFGVYLGGSPFAVVPKIVNVMHIFPSGRLAPLIAIVFMLVMFLVMIIVPKVAFMRKTVNVLMSILVL